MTLGQRIRAARKQRALTLNLLAERSGISARHLRGLECGKSGRGGSGPGIFTMQAIAGAMKMTLGGLMGERAEELTEQECAVLAALRNHKGN